MCALADVWSTRFAQHGRLQDGLGGGAGQKRPAYLCRQPKDCGGYGNGVDGCCEVGFRHVFNTLHPASLPDVHLQKKLCIISIYVPADCAADACSLNMIMFFDSILCRHASPKESRRQPRRALCTNACSLWPVCAYELQSNHRLRPGICAAP
jgi:hypothetical protein